MDRAEIAGFGVIGEAFAQIGAGGLQGFGLIGGCRGMVPESAPERGFADQPIDIPVRASEISGQAKRIGGGVKAGDKPAKRMVLSKNRGNRFGERLACLTQRLTLDPIDDRSVATV